MTPPSGTGAPRDDGAPTEASLLSMLSQFAIEIDEMEADGPWEEAEKAKLKNGMAWLVSRLPSLVAAQGQGLRDDGAPPVDALRIALTDAQTAFSGEDDRHAALGWLLAHLSSLIADSADVRALQRCEGFAAYLHPDGVSLRYLWRLAGDSGEGSVTGETLHAAIAKIDLSAPPHTGAS